MLFRLDRSEGLKQSELAEMLDLQPISLTRLLDRLADNGLIERRADPNDRRANRLFLTPAARPLLERLAELGAEHDGDGARRPRRQSDRAACCSELELDARRTCARAINRNAGSRKTPPMVEAS